MKCLAFCCLVPPILVATIVGYYWNLPHLPDTVEQQWQPRLFLALQGFAGDLAWLYGTLTGYEPELLIQKTDFLRTYLNKARPYPDTEVSWDMLSGVSAYVHQPVKTKKDRPALIYVHGGGLFAGSVYGPSKLCNIITNQTGAVVFAVDYRKHIYRPTHNPLEDVYAVAISLLTKGHRRGVDSSKVAVAGDSAGGILAAALALKLRDSKVLPPLVGQVLIYPWLQALDFNTPSRHNDKKYPGYALPRPAIANIARMYVNAWPDYMPNMLNHSHISAGAFKNHSKFTNYTLLPKSMIPKDYKPLESKQPEKPIAQWFQDRMLSPYYFPLMTNDTSRLPRSFVLTLEGDSLADDGAIYARRMKTSGCNVTHIHEPRGWHGMMEILQFPFVSKVGVEYTNKIVDFLRSCYGG